MLQRSDSTLCITVGEFNSVSNQQNGTDLSTTTSDSKSNILTIINNNNPSLSTTSSDTTPTIPSVLEENSSFPFLESVYRYLLDWMKFYAPNRVPSNIDVTVFDFSSNSFFLLVLILLYILCLR